MMNNNNNNNNDIGEKYGFYIKYDENSPLIKNALKLPNPNNPIIKTTVNYVIQTHLDICDQARQLIEIKGRDYNRQEQGDNPDEGDTLANMKMAKRLGLADSYCQSTLIRIVDKIMRLKSLTKDPNVDPAVKDEKVRNTIVDCINYLVYLDILYNEERNDNDV